MRRLYLALAVAAVFQQAVWSFGLNKVQYGRFNWSYYQTAHFNIYFPQGGDTVAFFAASKVEEMHDAISEIIGHELTARIPIILHNTHAEFEQTNVIRYPLHEAIGGFTEMFKNRIVLPFEGNYGDFYHVLKHEMVHAFINDLLMSKSGGGGGGQGAIHFPLWVNEGLAEYISLGWDLSSEFFMLDATTWGYVQHPASDFSGFLAYKGGQMFFHFMVSVYGEGVIKDFIREMRKTRNLETAFKIVTKTSLEEAGEIWLRELRYIYWPELGQRSYGKSVARRLTQHGKDLSNFNLQPAISPNGKEIAFFSDRRSSESVFIINLETEKVTRSVITGGTGGQHESFHSFKSGISWGPGSKRLAIVSKSKGKDAIHIIDAKSGSVLEEINPEVDAILSPSWSRDGRYICFGGMREGYSDIYVWDRDTKHLSQVTAGKAYDGKPCFSPSGEWIAFESDRKNLDGKAWGDVLNIYKIRKDGSDIKRISDGTLNNEMPSYGSSDSLLVYISNRSGIQNIYLSTESGDSTWSVPLTNILSGCFTPSWSADGGLLAFTVFEMGGWDVFLMKNPLDKQIDSTLPATHFVNIMADSSASFFRPVYWENLSSYKADTVKSKDSAETALHSSDSAAALSAAGPSDTLSADSTGALVSDSAAAGKNEPDSALALDSAGLDSAAAASLKKSGKKGKKDSGTDPENDDDEDEDEDEELEGRKKEKMVALDSSVYLDESGLFKKRSYFPSFSLDVAAAALGVSNFDGSFGQGYLVLTDLMGDQEIQIGLTLNGDLRDNSQFALEYHYLPYKPDFIIGGFYQSYSDRYYMTGSERSFGGHGLVLYPLSIFTRWHFELSTQYIIRENYDTVSTRISRGILAPGIGWSHDNTQWGIVGPVNGRRINASISVVPPAYEKDIFFTIGDVDFRNYWRFWKKYTLALRVNAGFSEAFSGYRNPHRFLVGGDDFINIVPIRADYNNLPYPDDIEGLFFADISTPLRGYDFFEFRGNRKVLSNLEFRFPFIRELAIAWPLPISIREVAGVIFCDYGAAWSYSRPHVFNDQRGLDIQQQKQNPIKLALVRQIEDELFTEMGVTDPLTGQIVIPTGSEDLFMAERQERYDNRLPGRLSETSKQWKMEHRDIWEESQGMGIGWGMRINLGVFVLRWTRAWPIDGIGNHEKSQTDYWSLGAEF